MEQKVKLQVINVPYFLVLAFCYIIFCILICLPVLSFGIHFIFYAIASLLLIFFGEKFIERISSRDLLFDFEKESIRIIDRNGNELLFCDKSELILLILRMSYKTFPVLVLKWGNNQKMKLNLRDKYSDEFCDLLKIIGSIENEIGLKVEIK